jgi:glycosyltransferase involved in cell wall biosynthesis
MLHGLQQTVSIVMRLLQRINNRREAASLVILDDIFPHILSAFRIAEYNSYLARYPESIALSTATAFPIIGETRTLDEVNQEFTELYPAFANRVRPFESHLPPARLACFMFVHNVRHFLLAINKSRTPFIFTLYPGFRLNQPQSDAIVSQICDSPNLRKIITTQQITNEYVRQFVDDDKVDFIYGGVFPSDRIAAALPPRRLYQQHKATFDICFVAFKYMPKAIDKGYDVFVAVARALSRLYDDVRFHVVGTIGPDDIDVSDFRDRIEFHGVQQTDFFPGFHAGMDLILSPNVPFVLFPGAFDGFPTGASIEAALCGVPVFGTDILRQNIAFKDGEEIVIISRDVDEICDRISHYRNHYDQLIEIGRKGQRAFQRELGLEAQMGKRFKIIDKLLELD